MTQTIIISGNCQTSVLAQAMLYIPWIAARYRILQEPRYYQPESIEPVTDDDWASCSLFFHQLGLSTDTANAPQKLSKLAKVISFPPLDFTGLWPFHTHDPLFQDRTEEYPNTRYPEPDRLVVELSEMTAEDLAISPKTYEGAPDWAALYDSLSEKNTINLARHIEIEAQRLVSRDFQVQVPMAGFILSHFKTERLFYTRNHPTGISLQVLLSRLLDAAWPTERRPGGGVHRATENIFQDWDPFSHHQMPVTRQVARRLGLTWWSEDQRYLTDSSIRKALYQTADEYIAAYARDRRELVLQSAAERA